MRDTLNIGSARSALGACLALCLSCAGTTAGGATTRFCNDEAGAYCDLQIRCGRVSASARIACLIATGASCHDAAVAESKGAQRYDAAQATACLTALTAARCSALGGSAETSLGSLGCTQVFTPAAAPGALCVASTDCVSLDDSCAGPACARTCQVTDGTLGLACPRAGSCLTGLRCDPATNMCVKGLAAGEACEPFTGTRSCDDTSFCALAPASMLRCTALPKVGETCSGACTPDAFCEPQTDLCQPRAAVGMGCGTDVPCQAALSCVTSTGTGGTCMAPVGTGGTCNGSDLVCALGLHCSDGNGGTPINTCVAYPTGGDPCFDFCGPGFGCGTITGTCYDLSAVITVQPGEACDRASFTQGTRRCGRGFACDGIQVNPDGSGGTPGTCRARNVGDACDGNEVFSGNNSQCPAGSLCKANETGATCVAAFTGAECLFDDDCLPTDFCDPGLRTCVTLRTEGEPCATLFDCASPLTCLQVVEGMAHCGALGDLGSSCLATTVNPSCIFPLSCQSGVCRPAGKPGEPCVPGFFAPPSCLEGACVDGKLCTRALAEGQLCGADSDCASGSCVNRFCVGACP